MLKGKITQEEFNQLYVDYRKNYKHWSGVNVTFEMICKMHGINDTEFNDRMNYLDNNPPAEIEDLFMSPTVDVEDRIVQENNLDNEDVGREKVIDRFGYELTDDDIYEDFIDERPEPKRYDDGGDDSNEY